MLASISSSSNLSQMTQSSSSSLSSSQKETISSILNQYDSDNISESDAKSIVQSIEDAGFVPSPKLVNTIEELGFDAKEIGELAGLVGKQEGEMPPPPVSDEEEETISSLLDTLLNIEKDEDENSRSTSTSFEDILEYTNRILNLNDESKEDVMELFEKYSNEDGEYSNEEINTLLKNSLSEILSNDNNYNSVSFYA